MAATVTVPKLFSGSVSKPEDESFPWKLVTTWHATKIADGTRADMTVTTDIPSADIMDQAFWDLVWAEVLGGYALVYSNAPTVAPTNPIAL
jgi:hypothetical protein